MKNEIGITAKKDKDFQEWYIQTVLKCDLADYSSAKGFMILRPYGFSIWEKIKEKVDSEIKKTGHKNAYFPSLIPESLLGKEETHFTGFTPEVFWVTKTGEENLSENLAIRPTSETIMYEAYSRWIRSWRDLPLLLNCWNSVLRAEIKSTKPFLRTSEFLWQEGHTVHATKEEAEKEVLDILEIYRMLIEEELAIPVLTGMKSDKEKFVGADFTTTLEAMMPDGKALQMGTSHHLGQNFSKVFEIRYLGKDKEMHFAWQTSWGVSWRLIGALIMAHGDDKGLILPPKIAPIQIIIIPIFYGDKFKEEILNKVKTTAKELNEEGLRTEYDLREGYTPGWKFNEWEMKGVPIRIEIGPKDLEKKQVTIVRRDNKEKNQVEEQKVPKNVMKTLNEIQESLYKSAQKNLENKIVTITKYDEFKAAVKKGGFIKTYWCSRNECEDIIKEETGADIRLIPFDEEKISAKCIKCNKKAIKISYFSRAY